MCIGGVLSYHCLVHCLRYHVRWIPEPIAPKNNPSIWFRIRKNVNKLLRSHKVRDYGNGGDAEVTTDFFFRPGGDGGSEVGCWLPKPGKVYPRLYQSRFRRFGIGASRIFGSIFSLSLWRAENQAETTRKHAKPAKLKKSSIFYEGAAPSFVWRRKRPTNFLIF